jgi:hypothetical protein
MAKLINLVFDHLLEHKKNYIYHLKTCKLAYPLPVCVLFAKKMGKTPKSTFSSLQNFQHNGLKNRFLEPQNHCISFAEIIFG